MGGRKNDQHVISSNIVTFGAEQKLRMTSSLVVIYLELHYAFYNHYGYAWSQELSQSNPLGFVWCLQAKTITST